MLTPIFRPHAMRAAGREDSATRSTSAFEPLAQAVHEFAIVGWEIVEEAVDSFDDDTPLRHAGDGAERIQSRLELVGDANTQLRVVLDLLAFLGASRRPARTT